MDSTQLLKNAKKEIGVTIQGSSYDEAVSKIFIQTREEVYKLLDGRPLINLKAQEVYFEDVKVDRTTERFLFLFWPREKIHYTIKSKVVIVIDYLDKKEEELK